MNELETDERGSGQDMLDGEMREDLLYWPLQGSFEAWHLTVVRVPCASNDETYEP